MAGERIPDHHSGFDFPYCLVQRSRANEILDRYDSGESIESIAEAMEEANGMPKWIVTAILYQASPQRVIAIVIDGPSDDRPSTVALGLLDPHDRETVVRWKFVEICDSLWETAEDGILGVYVMPGCERW